MDKDTKILLMAVVIILVALVSFNITDLTGQATTSASITVSPTTLSFGKYDTIKLITAKVNVGSGAVRNVVYLHRDSDNGRLGSESIILCRKSTCTRSDLASIYQYSVSSNVEEGRYYFRALDRSGKVVAESNRFAIEKL